MSSVPPSTQALHFPQFRLYVFGRILSTIAVQMQSVAVGWQIYDLTRAPISLGFVGLAQFLPIMLLILPAGDAADRFERRLILSASSAVQAFAAAILLVSSLAHIHSVWTFYGALILFGAARAFSGPAGSSLVPQLIPAAALTNATTLSSSAFQGAVIIGPALGGALYLLGPSVLYAACCAAFLASAATTSMLRTSRAAPATPDPSALRRVLAGIRFVRRTPIVLGAISLDLFAVLLGGATALLPIYASDILHAGPTGLGLLRSAPALGAATIGILLARYPFKDKAGPLMFGCVALFGLGTIVFGVSHSLTLSLIALVVMGAADMVSVIIRWTLIQLATPDEMRGRVSALNLLFVGASNELGEFESGFTAALFGTVPSVVIGGLGTIGVVGLWLWLFPALRKLDRLTDVVPKEEQETGA